MSKLVLKRALNFFILAATLTIAASIITYIINPDVKVVMEGINNRSSDQIKESTGLDKVWAYVVNNGFMVPMQMFILAFIPIQFLYFINVISTTILTGVTFGLVLQLDFRKGFELIIASTPHVIFEVFAYCILAAVLFKLNQVVRVKLKSLYKKNNFQEPLSLIKKFLEVIRTYAVFVLPIIVVAGFLETYIPDIIINLFQ
ncbi:stage II sporulation protein M [Alkalihalobacillus sp. LMS39]|uniref:stage II sporulation protein M n=1 Tax=Alkalihalobacillus sp. LMS39 TaxID=2924032 RepID=UPI001FB35A04|nr:stage II sporulation protein M [Alkalihalobacillus sp. LMS39]UOE94908.1 stage II sporulation protein M [Alkalihalobacillus sp. LMS39]